MEPCPFGVAPRFARALSSLLLGSDAVWTQRVAQPPRALRSKGPSRGLAVTGIMLIGRSRCASESAEMQRRRRGQLQSELVEEDDAADLCLQQADGPKYGHIVSENILPPSKDPKCARWTSGLIRTIWYGFVC